MWIGSPQQNYVARVDAETNSVAAVIDVAGGPADGVVASDGLVWFPLLNGDAVVDDRRAADAA